MEALETEVVVVGSGPSGATVARELARKARQVVLLEKGKWHGWQVGRYASVGSMTKLVRSVQGGLMGRAVTAGGSSLIFNGNAYEPPGWLASELRIDISPEVEQTRKELNLRPLPPEFYARWKGTQRLIEAADRLDIALLPQPKFIDADRCDPQCDDCMLGCSRGAKWTARETILQAQEAGATLRVASEVDRVIIEQGRARGVALRGGSEIRADKVVLSAGGFDTPWILQRSGIEAGGNFFVDPMNVVMGMGSETGTHREMTFAFASQQFVQTDGYLVGTVGSLAAVVAQLVGRDRFRAILLAPNLKRALGLFAKIGDTPAGRLNPDGSIEKPFLPEDEEKFRKGTETCKDILIKAGARPESICVAENIGGHPGGTAAIGTVVDRDLRTLAVENLFVCDASVLPHSPGRPPTLTLIGLAKRLAAGL